MRNSSPVTGFSYVEESHREVQSTSWDRRVNVRSVQPRRAGRKRPESLRRQRLV